MFKNKKQNMENSNQTRKHLLVAQAVSEYNDEITKNLSVVLRKINGCMSPTDSFDHALEIAASLPEERELIVISSFMFHENDDKKDGVLLAKKIKAMLSNAKVYILSEHEPGSSEYVDGFIKKTHSIEHDVKAVLKLLLPE
jgi:hypothetical protein